MKNIVLVLLFIAFLSPCYIYGENFNVNQVVKPHEEIKSMFENEQYNEIVDIYAGKPRTLSAEELTYVARSYYHLDDIENAFRYIDLALAKDAKYAPAYYAKGIINNAKGDYSQALNSLKKAIELTPRQSEYYAAIGDSYFAQENLKSALSNYEKAIKQTHPSEKAYYMIGTVYAALDSIQKALDAFYIGKSKIIKDKELYATTLYNIATIENDRGNFTKAVDAYDELMEYFPDDYYSMEKLIQCYNSLGQYSRADTYKNKLYTAYSKGELVKTSLFDKFCMDHFFVDKKNVIGYERYEEPSCRGFVKNIFYVTSDSGDVESSIFLEYVPAVEDGGKGNYKPVMIKGQDRYAFSVLFDEDVKYTTIQPYIIDIAAGKITGTLSVE